MGLQELAARLADTNRIGLSPQLAEKLKLPTADTLRGQLIALSEDDRGPLSVSLLAVYVVDDTDLWGDGEIYWWSIPVLVNKGGKVSWGPVSGLPAGAAPHKVGSLEWMTNLSLNDPPLLAVIPENEDVTACVIRLGIYDDDKKPADVPTALSAGYEALAVCKREGLPDASHIVTPVRDAIFRALLAEDDDILIDEDLTLRRGASARFNAGLVGSVVNAKVRVYYVVKDELRTETSGPFVLHKGQSEKVQFRARLERGGRISIFSRGADVSTDIFGDLTTDAPFAGKVLDDKLAQTLAGGFFVRGSGAAKLIAYYTPP